MDSCALRRDDRNALGLSGEIEELSVAGRIAFSDRREVLVFIAEEEDMSKILVFFRFDLRDAVQHRAFKIALHHHADGLGQPAFIPTGKFREQAAPCSKSQEKECNGFPYWPLAR